MGYASVTPSPLLHKQEFSRARYADRAFALVYACAVVALLYHHALSLLQSTTLFSFAASLTLLTSDAVLAFMWLTTQSYYYRPVSRRLTYPEKLEEVMKGRSFPALDVFICTADPFKEPPMCTVSSALSFMAYDYPPDKISIYLSDDGGSKLTLFAFMEAAKFAREWLPFCREKAILERSPEAYFRSNHPWCPHTERIKLLYENMKDKVESVVERGYVGDEHITTDHERDAFNKWTDGFTRQNHPTVIQVLLESKKDKDVKGHAMPNLIYFSREKRPTSPHHFKAGALNALLRVSAIMTNAPLVLTQDCDNFSNDPETPRRVLCTLLDPSIQPTLGYIQYPQIFHTLNKNDIYAGEFKRLYQTNTSGMDGLSGPCYVGSGCFFVRRVFFGGPSSLLSPDIHELDPSSIVNKPIQSPDILALAHRVASCDYESKTLWGSKMGFRYGSLVEDYHTGYQFHCEGWKSIFLHPKRAAFLGDAPITLFEAVTQTKRWSVGFIEVAFSGRNPLTYGTRAMGFLMGLAYSHYAYWLYWSIPITIYAFLPQLALLNGISIFPKVSDPRFFLYALLFIGAYVRDLISFIQDGGTAQRWWNDQRMWMIRGVSCFLFGLVEFFVQRLGICSLGFTLTSKVVDDQQSKRYDRQIFDFGVESAMFVPMTTAAIINLASLFAGIMHILNGGDKEGLILQMCLSSFVAVNCWPIYEAMVLRTDSGKMPTKITMVSTALVLTLCGISSLADKL